MPALWWNAEAMGVTAERLPHGRVVGETLEHRPQRLGVRRRRGGQDRVGLEQRPAGHGGVADVGRQLLDADVALGEGGGDLRHDAGVVGPEQVELQTQHLTPDGLVGALDGDREPLGLERVKVRSESVESVVGDGHQHDAGELARQP